MLDHEPSSLIPLHDGMVISFINYEIRVNLEKKTGSDLEADEQKIRDRSDQLRQTAAANSNFATTLKASAPAQVVEEEKVEEPVAVIKADSPKAASEAEPEEDHPVGVAEEQSIHGDEDEKVDEVKADSPRAATPEKA